MPVYNQIEEFSSLLEELAATDLPCDTLLLVNNGSDDGSQQLVRSSGYPYIDLDKNLGVGYSRIQAIEWALARDYHIFGNIASNGKMLPSEMICILEPLLTGQAEYVTGSRFMSGGNSPNLPTFRKRSIPLVNHFVQILTETKLSDATCGYRAYHLDIIRRANFDWHRPWLYTYGFEYYIYAKVLLDRNICWREVPITMRYPAKGKRYSKIKPFSGWYQMLKPWVVARFDGKTFCKDSKLSSRRDFL